MNGISPFVSKLTKNWRDIPSILLASMVVSIALFCKIVTDEPEVKSASN